MPTGLNIKIELYKLYSFRDSQANMRNQIGFVEQIVYIVIKVDLKAQELRTQSLWYCHNPDLCPLRPNKVP